MFLSLFSTHRKSQLARSQRVLSNIVIGSKFSQRACELGFVNALPTELEGQVGSSV